jgi:putative massive surface protein mspC
MNKKIVTTTLVLGTTIAGGAVLGQEAHASEAPATPSTDSNLVVKTEVGKTTQTEVNTAKAKADESKAKFDDYKAKSDVKIEKAKQDALKVSELEAKTEKGAKVTDEVIKEKTDKVTSLTERKADLTKKGEEAKPVITKTEENVKNAQKEVDATSKDLATKTEKVSELETKLNALENSDTVLKDKKDDVKSLTSDVEKAKADVTSKEDTLAKAKASDEQKAKDVAKAKDAVKSQKDVVAKKDSELKNATTKVTALEKEIKESGNPFGEGVRTEIKFDPEFVKALKKYTNANADTQATLLNGVIAKEREAVKKYPILNTDNIDYSNSEKVDINNLSEKDQILLTQYFNHLNNQVRKQFGLTPAKTNLNVLKFAQDIAKFTKESGYQDTHHDNRSINRAAFKNGIDKTDKGDVYNRFESLDFNTIDKDKSKGNMVARQFLFDSVYQSVQRFYHEGRMNRHYLHAEHMLNTNDETFGTYFVMTPSKSQYYNWVRFGVVGINKWNGFTGYGDNGPTFDKFDKNWGYKSPQTIDLIQVKDVSALKDKLATAKSTVTTLQTELDKATGELTKRENELKAIESQPSTVAEATKALQDAKVARDIKVAELAKAEKELKDIQDIIDNEQAQAKALRDELVKANEEVAKAEEKSAKAKAELVEAQKLEEQAKQAMKSLTDELDRLTNEITKAESEKAELVTLKAEYAENVKLLAKAKEDLEISRSLVSEAMVELADLQKDATEKFDAYLKVKRQYDMENLTWAVTKDTPVFELPEFDIKELDKLSKPSTSTQKSTTKVPSTKVTTTKTNAQAPKFGKASAPKTTVKSDERKLPNTGDTTTDLAGFGIVSMLMASYAMTMRRRENEK